MADSKELQRLAREVFGWNSFRTDQLQAIEAAVNGRDVLAVMPTGHGKSAIYQVAALALEGPAIVVSPLIALQAARCGRVRDDCPEDMQVEPGIHRHDVSVDVLVT